MVHLKCLKTWTTSWENLFNPFANNKGADQPAHPRSLISAFFFFFFFFFWFCLDSINSRNFKTLTSLTVVEQAGVLFSRTHLRSETICSPLHKYPFRFQKSVVLCDVVKYNIFNDIHSLFWIVGRHSSTKSNAKQTAFNKHSRVFTLQLIDNYLSKQTHQ